MQTPSRLSSLYLNATFLLLAFSAVLGAPPVFQPIPVLNPAQPLAPPTFPVGKEIIIPVAAVDPEGDAISLQAKSSNARLPVRIKTGRPILRIHVSYPGSGAVAAFEGDLDFQLFRDWAPVTAGFIGGFAQAGFYEDKLFYRVINDFVAQGGNVSANGTQAGIPFDFQHELHPALLFTGRGQLAMANSGGGYDRGTALLGTNIRLGDFSATNSSEFFITFGAPRHLTFKHTIFGQLIRGFDVLDKIEAVPTNATDRPTADVKMSNVQVLPSTGEATLFVGGNGLGESTITITATDSTGAKATQTLLVRTVPDTFNDRPVLKPLAPLLAPVGATTPLSVVGIDLEFDYLFYGIAAAGNGTEAGTIGVARIADTYTPRSTTGAQRLAIGVTGFNDPTRLSAATPANPFAPFDPYTFQTVEIGYGDRLARLEPVPVEGAPGSALTNVIVARLSDLDAAGTPADFTATINWGDATPEETGTLSADASRPSANLFQIAGSHTYARAGIYTVTLTVRGLKGVFTTAQGQAVITARALRALGQMIEQRSPGLANRTVATFTDTASSSRAADYRASIDWGDGVLTTGTISATASGVFVVRGSHVYQDPETFSVSVRVHKTGQPATEDAIAWSTVALSGFSSAPHLPPFPQAHLVGAWTNGPTKSTTGVGAAQQVTFSGTFFIVNSGNKTSRPGTLRFFLSNDATFDSSDVRVKSNGASELNIGALGPGQSGSATFPVSLPRGQSGGRKFLLAQIISPDPVADHEAIDRVISIGPIIPTVIVTPNLAPRATKLVTTEAGGTATFSVVLDTVPTHDVRIPISSLTPAEGTPSTTELVFTPANALVPQTVTLTGVDDAVKDGPKDYAIKLSPAVSTDTLFSGIDPADVAASNLDND